MSQKYDELYKKVNHAYHTCEGDFWELIMGRFIHCGGWYSSVDLASKAGIKPRMSGIDLCSNSGEAARFLVRNRGVRKMQCVDLSSLAVERGRKRSEEDGFSTDQISFLEANIDFGLPMFANDSFDFVWGEDAWCYVPDKAGIIKTAHRMLKPGGVICFTDWILGSTPMNEKELKDWLEFMTFPNQETVQSYARKMADAGFAIEQAYDTKRFTPCTQLYIDMIEQQLQGDVMRIFENDQNEYERTMKMFYMMLDLSKKGKIAQGLFVGRKKGGVMHQAKL